MQPKLLCKFEDGRVTSNGASYGNRDDNEANRKRNVRISIRLTDGFSLSVKGSETQLMLHIEMSAQVTPTARYVKWSPHLQGVWLPGRREVSVLLDRFVALERYLGLCIIIIGAKERLLILLFPGFVIMQ